MKAVAWKMALLVLLIGVTAGMLQAQETDKPKTDKAPAKTDKAPEKTDRKSEVSEAVKSAAAKLAGDAKVSFKAKGKNFKAEWKVGEHENEALYGNDGKLIRSEIKLDLKDLPEAVRNAVTAKYGVDTVLEFTKITIAKGDKVIYEVESESKGDTRYTAAGVETDDDGEAGEEDDDDDNEADDDEDDDDEDDDDDDDD
ncbi:MAG: hypothetical protein H6839_00620 [Planctomycetes bacterium]|nr:hypothetical protein [Planctomycetota bacterium]